ncbi:protein polyglutamylation [Tritrichomonas musculus]|uniref:Protein polyglutamylation n=1 Tax=Tritrichomonas musculus TaxID=1915356 RepID=A0ABR2JF28_9EUKA
MLGLFLLYQLSVSIKGTKDDYKAHTRIADSTEPINLENALFSQLGDIEENGGGILINKNKVSCTLVNCKFDSCKATNGGAIYLMYSGSASNYECKISDTLFSNCESKTHGGAVYAQVTQSNSHSLTITGCTFTANTAGKSGGAIYAMVRDSCTIEKCSFNGNRASDVGSSIWCRIGWNDRYNVNELIIQENTFEFTPTSKKSVNVYIDSYVLTSDTTPNANLELGGCTFSIISNPSNITGYKQLEISEHNSHFESIKFSGCNCVKDVYGTVSLPFSFNPNSTFAYDCTDLGNCEAPPIEPTPVPKPDNEGYTPYEERVLRLYKEYPPNLILVKAKFSNIEYLKNDIGGGAIAIDRVTSSIVECKFIQCYTSARSYGGGAIYVAFSGTDAVYTCSIIGSKFENCNVTNNGGALFLQTLQPDRHSITVEGCTFTNNIAGKLGGAVYVSSRDLIAVRHCTFENNQALNGSSLYARVGHANGKDTNDRFTLIGNSFTFTPSENNLVDVRIESIKLETDIEPRAHLIMGDNTFAVSEGATSYQSFVIDAIGKLKQVTFIGCNCVQGGADTIIAPSDIAGLNQNIVFNCPETNKCPEAEKPPATEECPEPQLRRDSVERVELKNVCFSSIKAPAEMDGGAVHIVNAPLIVSGCNFWKCSTEGNGGAIYATYSGNTCDLNVRDSIFESCSAGLYGGAFYFVNSRPTSSTIENCKFYTNQATNDGGALYYSPCARSSLRKCFFLNNEITKGNTHGTGVYAIIRNPHKDINNDEVVIANNRFRSELASNTQQFYINMKKSGNLQLGFNAFSFNKANITSVSSKYLYFANDEGSNFRLSGNICVDANETRDGLVYGISDNIQWDCHRADVEWDNYVEPEEEELNLAMAIGIAAACGIAVIAIVVVVLVIITIKQRKNN